MTEHPAMIELQGHRARLCFDSLLRLGSPRDSAAFAPAFTRQSAHVADPFGLGVGVVHVEGASLSEAAEDPALAKIAAGLTVVRETWRPDAGSPWLACRLRLRHDGSHPVEVAQLAPLQARGPDALQLHDSAVADWILLRQPRLKNDMPACIRLGDERPGIWDAVRGTPETGGLPRGEAHDTSPTRFVSSELTVLRGGGQSLCLGWLPLDRQLVRVHIELARGVETAPAGGLRLREIGASCECDGQLLHPGEALTSQWLLVQFDADTEAAVRRYTTALRRAHPGAGDRSTVGESPARTRPPTVWCSWYYYGDGFTQRELASNLAALERRPLPIDVIQIDECWDTHWGDWQPNEDWPGLAGVTQRIHALGSRAGIWTCPVLAEPRSRTRYANPHWLLRDRSGEPVRFSMNDMSNYVLDPTHPEVAGHIEGLFRRLRAWGLDYFKLDFLRAMGHPEAVFHDRTCNRADAYRRALEAVRRGAGPEAYVNVCGGFYGPALGLADAQRSGSDVRSAWPAPPAGEEEQGYGPFTIKQNTLRRWQNQLWNNDPDALMVRRRRQAARDERLSLGLLTDDEALTCALNQYLGGGLVCFTENLAEIDDDRLLLLRHCAPSVGRAAVPRDLDGSRFPAVFDTRVQPAAPGLTPWHTLSLVNWLDVPRTFTLRLRGALPVDAASGRYRVSARRGEWVRDVDMEETLQVGPLAAHACEVLKVQRCAGPEPMLVWTDGHFSMGGTEIAAWSPTATGVRLRVDWPWPTPLRLRFTAPAALPAPEAATSEIPTHEVIVHGPAVTDVDWVTPVP